MPDPDNPTPKQEPTPDAVPQKIIELERRIEALETENAGLRSVIEANNKPTEPTERKPLLPLDF